MNKVRNTICLAAGALVAALAVFFTVKTILETDMPRIMKNVQMEYGIPEMAVAVMNSHEILYESVTGVRRSDTMEPAEAGDRFHLGSCTKAVTSLIAGKMVEEGKIGWDTKLLGVYPEFSDICKQEYRDITFSDLLSNRAGLIPFTGGNDIAELPEWNGTIRERRREFVQWMLQVPFDDGWVESTKQMGYSIEPGGKPFVYSNAAYTAAALMMERVSGKSWEELAQYYLGDQLGLAPATGWPNLISPNQPWGHAVIEGKLTCTPPDNAYRVPELLAPSGDMNLSLKDFEKLLQMQLRGLRGEDNFLKADTYAYIHKSLPGYALGWENINLFGHRVSFHEGTAGTYYCVAAIDDEHDLAFVIMANAGGEKASQGMYWLAYKLFKNYNGLYWLFFI